MSNITFTNFAATTLASGINTVVTSLTVATGTGTLFPTLAGAQYFYAVLADAATGTTREVIKVTARSTDTFTIVRAQDNTTAKSYITGDKIELRLTAAGIATLATTETAQTLAGVQTFSSQPIMSTLTASSALASDASKGLVSVTNTGSGNNVLATSPTISGATLTTSIFNGTVGATTPSTGAFTTVTASAGSGVRAVLVSGGSIASFYDSSAVEQGRIQASTSALFLTTVTTNPININVNSTTVGTFNAYGLGLGTAVPSSGIGLSFPATQSASTDANTLDDYEEGTFTPTYTFGNVAHNGTYSYQSGVYTKVGRLVTVTGTIGINSAGTATGTARITGLPFTAMNQTGNSVVLGVFNGFTGLTGTALFGDGPTNNALTTLYQSNAGTAAGVDKTNFTTGGSNYIEFTFSYFST